MFVWFNGFLNICVKKENLKLAQQYFQLVGGSASDCGIIYSNLQLINIQYKQPPN